MDVRRADPKRRRRVAVGIAATAVVGALAFAWLGQWLAGLSDLPATATKSRLLTALAACWAVLCLSVLGFGLYVRRLGARVVAQARFPLRGTRRVRDVRAVEGEPARRYGRWLRCFGAALLLLALGSAVIAWRLYAALAAAPA